MIQSQTSVRSPSGTSAIYRAMLIALALLPIGCNRDEQPAGKAPPSQPPTAQSGQPTSAAPAAPQAPAAAPQPPVAPAAPPPAAKPLSDLESLVAPIALYPDPLLAELLVASTYPLEVVQAARWLETKPDLATLSGKDWDASIMRLASVPDVLKMMNDHLDWTTQLGDAFLAKPAELMDAIQGLRKRATDSGFLKTTPEQKVTTKTASATAPADETAEAAGEETGAETVKATPAVLKKEVITIEPAQSETIYVPRYNPETAYQAPLAPPPTATTAAYPATGYAYPAAAPAPAYYPAYYPPPPPATTTTSTSDTLLTFGAGALAGGLLTWGIMEWADDDDWDHYHGYPVNHYYGGAVCNGGNCWNGGGGGYYGDRGNINRNTNINRDRDVNISGNEINIDRGGVFSQRDLQPTQVRSNWQPDARHRRGQTYPPAAQQRIGRTEPPALAGQRLGAAQTLPATARGFGEGGTRPGTLPAERRPSSAEIQQRLAQKPGGLERRGETLGQPRPSTRDIQGQLGQGGRENALAGLRDSGQATRIESRRGAESRRQPQAATREVRTREPAGGREAQRRQTQQPRQFQSEGRQQFAERRAEPPRRPESRQAFEGRQREQAQQMDRQRRSESSRPNAFEGGRSARATQNFSQRGASSRQASAGGGRFGGGGGAGASGGGRFGSGGGGGPRGGGGRRR